MSLSVEAANASLSFTYGATKHASAPASFEVDLYAGHPDYDGTLLTTGYTAPTVTNDATGFPNAPVGGEIKAALVTVTFMGDLTEPATHWRFRDPATGVGWDCGEFVTEMVGGAGTSESFEPVAYYGEGD